VLLEGFHGGVGQGFTGFQPVLGAELVVGGGYGDVFELAGAGEDALGFGNDFGADAVAGDDGIACPAAPPEIWGLKSKVLDSGEPCLCRLKRYSPADNQPGNIVMSSHSA